MSTGSRRSTGSGSGSGSCSSHELARLRLLVLLDALQGGEREPLVCEHHEPDADADRHLDRLEDEPVGEARPVGDAVLSEWQRDGGLEQPDVPGPEREDGRDVHEEEHERRGGQRDVEAERLGRSPDGEELQRPADGLEEDRRERRGGDAQDRQALSRHGEEPPGGSLPVHRRAGVTAGREQPDRQQPEPDQADRHDTRDRPVRQLRREHDVADEQRDREDVEHAVREDGPEQRRPGAAALGQVPTQDCDAGELAGPRGEHGVPEQADAERREDRPEARWRRRHRLVDRDVPRPRARDDREQVEQDCKEHPAPADEGERVVDGVPLGPAPPEHDERGHERGEHPEPSHPGVAVEREDDLHAARASRTPLCATTRS